MSKGRDGRKKDREKIVKSTQKIDGRGLLVDGNGEEIPIELWEIEPLEHSIDEAQRYDFSGVLTGEPPPKTRVKD